MSNIQCIIIEDEPFAVKILTDYISQVPFLVLQRTFKDALSAAAYLQNHSPDLIFLDIHLPKVNGISFLKSLPNPPAVIMTTAYHQYAVEGFSLNVIDYLLKPFEFERFLAAVNKVAAHRGGPGAVSARGEKEYVVVASRKKKFKIFFREILYIESQKEYVRIVTADKAFRTKISTARMEKVLPRGRFLRIHRSFIVSVQHIRAFSSESVEIQGVSIPIGRSYKHVVKSL